MEIMKKKVKSKFLVTCFVFLNGIREELNHFHVCVLSMVLELSMKTGGNWKTHNTWICPKTVQKKNLIQKFTNEHVVSVKQACND